MLQKSTLLHLRIPFSFFLMPVFFFAVAVAQGENLGLTIYVFLIIHLLIYPASNGYNSYYDRDEDSIGGLEKPPPVSRELWQVSILLDSLAVILGLWVGIGFALGVFIYGMVSKAYSHEAIRLKKYPIMSWLVIGIFQGAFSFFVIYQGIMQSNWAALLEGKVLYAALLSSTMLLGSYPMTQVYQHEEDARRGDLTLSRLLGIRGTFLFTTIVFSLSSLGYFLYFQHYFGMGYALAFLGVLFPVLAYFMTWFLRVLKDQQAANFKSTMRLNLISALCLNGFFITMATLV